MRDGRDVFRVLRGRPEVGDRGPPVGDTGTEWDDVTPAAPFAFGAMQSHRCSALAMDGREVSEGPFEEAVPVLDRQWWAVKPKERVAGRGGGAEDAFAKGMCPRTAIGEIIAHMVEEGWKQSGQGRSQDGSICCWRGQAVFKSHSRRGRLSSDARALCVRMTSPAQT